MKIKLELFGASRDFSSEEFLEFNIKQKMEIKDLRKEIINYLDKNFKGNENFIKIVKNSAFCSEDNNIINDDFKIIKDQKIGIHTSNRWWLMLHAKIIDFKKNKIETSAAEAFIKSSSYGASIIFNGTVRNINLKIKKLLE